MRIVFDVSYIQTRRAGIGRYSTELLLALLSADTMHEYVLHGWSYSIDRNWLRSHTTPNTTLSIRRLPGQIKRIYWNHVRSIPLQAIVGDFDVFHSADPLIPPLGGRSAVITVHDVAYLRLPHFFEPHVLRWGKSIERSVANASVIVVPSEFARAEAAEMLHLSPERLITIRPPVAPIFKPEAEHSDKAVRSKYNLSYPFVLYVGTIEPRKNLITLIHAFERMTRGDDHPHHLVIVGKYGWKFEETHQALRTSPARPRIHHFDFISDSDLAAIYRLADVFVYPSWYEGHGSPVVEAMASGKAVVTSDRSALPEVVADAALLVDPSNANALADTIAGVLNNPALKKDLQLRALHRASFFSREIAAEKLLNAYEMAGRR